MPAEGWRMCRDVRLVWAHGPQVSGDAWQIPVNSLTTSAQRRQVPRTPVTVSAQHRRRRAKQPATPPKRFGTSANIFKGHFNGWLVWVNGHGRPPVGSTAVGLGEVNPKRVVQARNEGARGVAAARSTNCQMCGRAKEATERLMGGLKARMAGVRTICNGTASSMRRD